MCFQISESCKQIFFREKDEDESCCGIVDVLRGNDNSFMTLRTLTTLKIINLLANSNFLHAAVLLLANDGGNDRDADDIGDDEDTGDDDDIFDYDDTGDDDDIGDDEDIFDILNLLQAAVLLLDQPRAAAFLLKASPSRSAVLALLWANIKYRYSFELDVN